MKQNGVDVIPIGIDETDWCDSCGSTEGSGVLFNPGKQAKGRGRRESKREDRRRNFAVCSICLISAMRANFALGGEQERVKLGEALIALIHFAAQSK